MSFKTTFAATVTALAMAPLGMGAAIAQEQSGGSDGQTTQSQQQAPAMASSDVSDDMIETFVDTALEVQTVQQSYREQAQSASSEEELQSIAEEANAEIVSVVENAQGLTMDEYVAISESAQADEELMNRITAELQSRQQNSEG